MEDQIQNNNSIITNQIPQTPQTPQIPVTSQTNWSKFVLIVVLALVLVSISTFILIQIVKIRVAKNVVTEQESIPATQAVQSTIPVTHPTESPVTQNIPSEWKVKVRDRVQFYYPPSLESLVNNSKRFSISVRPKQEIIKEYEKNKSSGGCPSTCGMLTEDSTLLQKQFTLLSSLTDQTNCVLSSSYKEDIKNNFILFTGGINNKVDISSLKINNGNCLLRIIETDGFDADLQNYYYKAGYMSGDDVVEIKATLFPFEGFSKIEGLWKNLGYNFTTNVCDTNCLNKELNYYQNFNVNDSLVKEVVSTYDQMFSTLSVSR